MPDVTVALRTCQGNSHDRSNQGRGMQAPSKELGHCSLNSILFLTFFFLPIIQWAIFSLFLSLSVLLDQATSEAPPSLSVDSLIKSPKQNSARPQTESKALPKCI